MGISRREYARRRCVDEKSIRKHLESGLLTPALLPDNTIDPDRADELLAGGTTRGGRTPAALAASRHRKLRAATALAHDDTAELRCTTVARADARERVTAISAVVARRLRAIPAEAASRVSGLPLEASQPILRDAIYNALTDLSGGDDPPPSREPTSDIDLSNLSAAATAAKRNALQAEKMELERARNRGDAVDVNVLAHEFEIRLASVKSLLTAIASNPSLNFSEADEPTARSMIASDIERAIRELECDLVSAKDLRNA